MTAPLDPRLIAAAATIWVREQHEIVTKFDGVSMLPAIGPGSEVRLRFTRDVHVGDVVLTVCEDRIVLHRLVGRGRDWIVTHGDANFVPDQPLHPTCVVARVLEGPAQRVGRYTRCKAMVRSVVLAAMRIHPALGRATITLLTRLLRSGTARSLSGSQGA